MADEKVKPRRDRPRSRRAAKPAREPVSGERLASEARRQLSAITGMEPGMVTSMERSDDDGWKLNVELVELSRIPRAADVLGVYEVKLDAAGSLLGYRRVRRYSRGETVGAHDV